MMCRLKALELITVRAHSFTTPNDYGPQYEDRLIATAGRIRDSLLLGAKQEEQDDGPQIAIIFPGTKDWREDM